MRQLNPVLMNQLKADHLAAKQLGSPLLQCQGMLVPRDPVFQATRLLIQSCPRPMVTNNDPAEIAYAGGLDSFVPGVPKTKYEGSITVIETEKGQAALFAEYILANGGNIPCDYYDGRPGYYTRVYALDDCAIRLEPTDTTADGRSQITLASGSITYMYFGLFAKVGASGSALPGDRGLSGIEGFIDRVQGVLNVAQTGVNALGAVAQFGRGLQGLLG